MAKKRRAGRKGGLIGLLVAVAAAVAYLLWKLRKAGEIAFNADIQAMKEIAFSDLKKPDEIAKATEEARAKATANIEAAKKEEIVERFHSKFKPKPRG